MLTNYSCLSLNQMGDLLLLPITFYINESSMVNIFYFVEVANILGVQINMEKSKEKVINVHIKYGKIVHYKACAEGLFYTNINYPTMTTNTTNVSLNSYSYISTVKQNSYF